MNPKRIDAFCIDPFYAMKTLVLKNTSVFGFVERLPPAMRVSRKKFYLCVEKENLQ